MLAKIIFVLATVCVIKASVVNVFDDDPETEVASNPKDCNFRACDQLCRRLKFPGGTCVNGRCKCDKFLNAEDGFSDKSLSNVENPVSQQDDPEVEVAASKSKCKLKACDLVCRWLKKKSGSCVDGRCKCAKSLVAESDMTDPAEFLSPGSCNFRACDQQCFRYGYSGGSCVNGRCKCHKFLNAEDIMTDAAESLPLSSCNSIACDDKCRRTGWHSGVCIKGQCKCDHFLNTEDAVTGNALSNLEDSISLKRCTCQACNVLCRRLKFPGGTCVNGRCKCDNVFGTRDASPLNDVTSDKNEESNVILRTYEEEQIVPSLRACNTVTCNQMCHRLNYAGGWCRFGQCQCY